MTINNKAISMDKLRTTFEKDFGIPFDILPLPNDALQPVFVRRRKTRLFGSAVAAKQPYLIQSELDLFMKNRPLGYFLVGYWGHGLNSHAFYYCRVDAQSAVFLRLSYGGLYLYSDNKAAAAKIARFLPAYFAFEQTLIERGYQWRTIDSMGYGYYEVITTKGRSRRHGSRLYSADFAPLEQLLTRATSKSPHC